MYTFCMDMIQNGLCLHLAEVMASEPWEILENIPCLLFLEKSSFPAETINNDNNNKYMRPPSLSLSFWT